MTLSSDFPKLLKHTPAFSKNKTYVIIIALLHATPMKSMKKLHQNKLVLILAPVIIALQIFLVAPQQNIINVHESIEQLGDIAKLQVVMDNLGITSVVLHGIPQDLIRYSSNEEVNLAEVEENHEYLMQAAEVYPEEFDFFCSIDPSDVERLQMMEECFEEGALGIKFYNGYSYAHEIELDDPRLNELYAGIKERDAILMLPVNTSKYQDELENMLTLHPNLTVICSHYCLSSKSLERAAELLRNFPNLYVDTSFGHIDYTRDGFTTISENHDAFVDFFGEFQDRILFATDTVVTSFEDKTTDWLTDLYSDYLSILTEDEFESAVDEGVFYKGLDLSLPVQNKVFWQNWSNLLE